MLIRYIYTVFLGILLAVFVGVGIAAFYAPPLQPSSSFITPPFTAQNEKIMEAQQKQEQAQYKAFTHKDKMYSRNVSIISLGFAILFLIISLIVLSHITIFSDGFLLGSLSTLLYSITRGFGSDDSKYQFVVVAISLIIAVTVGYIKFIKSVR